MARERLLERVASRAVLGQRAPEMRAEVAAVEELGEHVLKKKRRTEIDRLLDAEHRRSERARTDDEPDAKRRDELLAERADVKDVPVERPQSRRRQTFAQPKIRTVVVLDEWNTGALRPGDEVLAPRSRDLRARRIVAIRHEVE